MDPIPTSPSPPRPMHSFSDSTHGSVSTRDPDGTYKKEEFDEDSAHGEDLVPTRQDSYDELFEDEETAYAHSSNILGSTSTSSSSRLMTASSSRLTNDGSSSHSHYANANATATPTNNNGRPSSAFQSLFTQQEEYEDELGNSIPQAPPEEKRPSLLPLISEDALNATNNSRPRESSVRSMPRSTSESEGYLSATNRSNDDNKEPKHSPFPSVGMLVCLAILVVAVVAALVGGLTYYAWDKKYLDPLRPPGGVPAEDESGTGGITGEVNVDGGTEDNPMLPTDDYLLELFASALNVTKVDLLVDGTSPQSRAARWMLDEDPGKASPALLPRSNEAWIQRFLLAQLYYATTLGFTSWRSCNPDALDDDTEGLNVPTVSPGEEDPLDEASGCWFASPTELHSGELVYDGWIPSSRWLSGTDECSWGGVACGTTVSEEIPLRAPTDGNVQPVNYQRLRSAVSSLSLAGQNLRGSLNATALDLLPHLRDLDLSHNGLVGTIAPGFSSLVTLRLQHNFLFGSLPEGLFGISTQSSTASSSNSTNSTTNSEEKSTTITTISPLVELNVGANRLGGSIPEDIGLVATQLQRLMLYDNRFTGTIPVLGFMPLEAVHAQNNKFTGMLPFEKDYGGPWPTTLREWWVYGNSIGGSIPSDLGRFAPSLHDLRLHDNELTGSIPESIGDLHQLWRLTVHSNNLEGSIPSSLGVLEGLQELKVQFNKLEGSVPPSICLLESMEVLEADCVWDPSEAALGSSVPVTTFATNGVRRRATNNDVIPSFPTLEEAVAAARNRHTDPPSPTSAPVPGVPTIPTAAPTGFPTRADGTTTEIQCYCCTRCCNARTGDCLAFSAIGV